MPNKITPIDNINIPLDVNSILFANYFNCINYLLYIVNYEEIKLIRNKYNKHEKYN